MIAFRQDKSEIKNKAVLMKNEAIDIPNKNIKETREKIIIRIMIDTESLIRTRQIPPEDQRVIRKNILLPEGMKEIINTPANIALIETSIREEKDKADTEMIEAIQRRKIEATIMSTKEEETTADLNLDPMKDPKKDLDLTTRTDITMIEIGNIIQTIRVPTIGISTDDDIFYIL